MAQAPDELLRDLFEAAPGACSRFAAKVALSDELGPPKPPLRVRAARAAPCDPRAPMDVLLRVLARDEATSLGSIEGLFEELEGAHRAGLIAMDATGLALTDAGRDLMRATRDALAPLGDSSPRRIELFTREAADGPLTLRGERRASPSSCPGGVRSA